MGVKSTKNSVEQAHFAKKDTTSLEKRIEKKKLFDKRTQKIQTISFSQRLFILFIVVFEFWLASDLTANTTSFLTKL